MSDGSLPVPESSHQAMLAVALKAIRESRRLRIADMARLMDMAPRSYEHFEAGRGKFDLDKLQKFAEVTDSDPFAILASVMLKDPEFAVRTADNKPMVVFMLALRDFNNDLRDDIALIEPRLFVGAFRRVFQELVEHVRNRDLTAENWLDAAASRVGLNLSFRRGVAPKKG
ncbi:helix-turn-helix domain-containing protein [Phenylobacterium sp.]|uniref:helix-turn-helix domain-containing protein n=1 Tax=Phenylobacterium sp. TaxID=1871053 RepID=UPI0035B0DF67